MKEIMQSLLIATTGLTIAFAIGNRAAHASTFVFSQRGWQLDDLTETPTGGVLNGVFSGRDDIIKDGIISFGQGEVSFFEMRFEGDSAVDNFTHILTEEPETNNLFRLEYPLANPEMLEIFSSNLGQGGSTTYDGGVKLIQQQGEPNDFTIVTEQSPVVREVSEPTSLIGLTLFGLGFGIKRSLGKD